VRLGAVAGLLSRRFAGLPDTLYYAAASSFLQGQLPAARGFIQQVIAGDPRRADAYNMLGAIEASRGQPEEARRAFEAALRLDPRGSATYTNLGLLELSTGNRSRAADLFAEALSLDPASVAARNGLRQSLDPHP
jgi:Flp pilus assembly protein TadD